MAEQLFSDSLVFLHAIIGETSWLIFAIQEKEQQEKKSMSLSVHIMNVEAIFAEVRAIQVQLRSRGHTYTSKL